MGDNIEISAHTDTPILTQFMMFMLNINSDILNMSSDSPRNLEA